MNYNIHITFKAERDLGEAADYIEFINGETRYSSLKRSFPGKADELFSIAAENSIEKYNKLARLVDYYAPAKD